MQVRFGARSGAAPVFLGLLKVVLGLVFGSSLYQLLKAFPQPILGALMIFSGASLCGLIIKCLACAWRISSRLQRWLLAFLDCW